MTDFTRMTPRAVETVPVSANTATIIEPVEPKPSIRRSVLGLLRSRKVLLALAAIAQTVALDQLGVAPEVWASIDAILAVVIGGIAAEDAAAKRSAQPVIVQPTNG
jgi:hypothetical protein